MLGSYELKRPGGNYGIGFLAQENTAANSQEEAPTGTFVEAPVDAASGTIPASLSPVSSGWLKRNWIWVTGVSVLGIAFFNRDKIAAKIRTGKKLSAVEELSKSVLDLVPGGFKKKVKRRAKKAGKKIKKYAGKAKRAKEKADKMYSKAARVGESAQSVREAFAKPKKKRKKKRKKK